MKDLSARAKTLVVLLALATLSEPVVSFGQLAVSPTSISFGAVPVGHSQAQDATMTNSSGFNVTVSQASVSGTGFSLSGLILPVTLAAGQSANFNVNFTPPSGGSSSGTVSLVSSGSTNNGNHYGKGHNGGGYSRTATTTVTLPVSGMGTTAGQLAASPLSMTFGNVQMGASQSLSVKLTNTGASSITISQATVTGAGFSMSGLTLPLALAAGQSRSFSISFAPTSGGTATGNVAITSDASNPSLNLPLSGTGVTPGSLTDSASSLSFGNVQVGSSSTLSETLTNSGGSTVTVSQAKLTGSGFSITGLTLPLTLIPGQSFTFGTDFAPATGGSFSGSIAMTSNASNATLTISLSGTGAVSGQLGVSPATLNFGSVVVGQTANMPATLSATGSSVTVSSASSNSSEFTLSGVSFPFTIAAGKSAPVTVSFTPQASGTASASVSFASNASNTPAMESLTGNGTAPPQHSVALSWKDTSSGVVGYNIYRGSISGGPYTEINSALNASTSYTDSTVQAGLTFYYATTAVDGSGRESGYSNQVQAVIPTP
jgi:hypothetical protein